MCKFLSKLHLLATYRFLECRSFFQLFFFINFSNFCVSVLNCVSWCVFFCIAYATYDSLQLRQPTFEGALQRSILKSLQALELYLCSSCLA